MMQTSPRSINGQRLEQGQGCRCLKAAYVIGTGAGNSPCLLRRNSAANQPTASNYLLAVFRQAIIGEIAMIGLPSLNGARGQRQLVPDSTTPSEYDNFLFPVHGISCLLARHSLVFTIMHLD